MLEVNLGLYVLFLSNIFLDLVFLIFSPYRS